ncbi:MAG: Hsp20/alpha crystallin family protein [Anaerolineaceae bacterium]|nr:Hsp20/alpha crystallin family protein [Anaerolineaceae bacterium]
MRYIARFNPVQDLVNLQDAFERAFDFRWPSHAGSAENKANYRLPLDVFEREDGYTIFASLPGVAPEHIEINIEDDVLSIQADVPASVAGENAEALWRERRFGTFQRQLRLPAPINQEAITAETVDGVLQLTLPKEESAQVHQIPVQSAHSSN